jgi:hypothetical protein
MSLEKITSNGAKTAEEIKKMGEDNGVSEGKFRDSNLYDLPLSGEFVDFEVHKNEIDGNEVSYYVMKILDKNGVEHEYPVSSMQRMLNTDIANAKEGEIAKIGGTSAYKDYFKLLGAKPINPTLMGNQAKVIEMLLTAKEYNAQEVNGFVCTFTDKKAECKIQPKSGYKVAI